MTPSDLCWTGAGDAEVDVSTFLVESRAAQAASALGRADLVLAHAAAALALYRGAFLPGNCDEWSIEARADLDRECVALCDLVCVTPARSRDIGLVLDAARRRIALRPLEEVGYRVLMSLQAGEGDRAAALGTYHRCATLLEQELGVTPDQSTREVMRQLRTAEGLADRSRACPTSAIRPPRHRHPGPGRDEPGN